MLNHADLRSRILVAALVATSFGCPPKETDSDSDTDVDMDIDTDTDADSDGDSDEDY